MTDNNIKHNEWWRGSAIYQIYPRSFLDTNGDGVGDLKGITEKLEYIASLHVDGIWISPFFLSPMKDYGYDVSDFCTVDPIFGGMDDFDALLKKAHDLDLKVIIDFALNHTSEEHAWFQESNKSKTNAKADWYVWANPKSDGSPPNNWQSIFGGPAWTFHTGRSQYYMHSFLKEQPELNYHNPEVRKTIFDIARFWLDKGVDGFRLDAVNHCFCDDHLRDNPGAVSDHNEGVQFDGLWPYSMQQHIYDKSRPEMIAFIEELRALTDEYEGRYLIGEIGDDHAFQRAAEYTEGDKRLHTAYSTAMMGGQSVHINAETFSLPVKEELSFNGTSWPSWAYCNHDVVRVASRWDKNNPDGNPNYTKMLMASLGCLRGSYCVYQGEELGLKEAILDFEDLHDPWGIATWPAWQGRDGCRTPMPWDNTAKNTGFSDKDGKPWLPVCKTHVPMAVSVQEKDPNSMLNFTRKFMEWRKKQTVLRTGHIEFCDFGNDVLGFIRYNDDTQMLCVFNLSNTPQELKGIEESETLYSLGASLEGGSLSLDAFGFAICA